MYNSPIITQALMESRQRDMIAAARNARLAREAGQATRASREAPAPVRGPAAKRRWHLALVGLFGAR